MTQAVVEKPTRIVRNRRRRTTNGHLSAAEERFCQIYYATGDAFVAYKEAGYSTDTKWQSQRILIYRMRNKPAINARLREMAESSLEDLRQRRGELVSKLLNIANADVTEILSVVEEGRALNELPPEKRAIIKSVKPTKHGMHLELHDKLKAIDLLARISGLMVDKIDVTSSGLPINNAPVQIVFEVVSPEENKKYADAEVVEDDGSQSST